MEGKRMKTFLIIVLLNTPGLPYKAFEFPTEAKCEEARRESKPAIGSNVLTFCAPRAVHEGTVPGWRRRAGMT